MCKIYLHNLATDKYNDIFSVFVKFFLFFLSLIYGLIIRCSIFFYRLKPYGLGCKVVSVGNITLGGTGKTPLVEYIARYLKEQGHKAAILSRGYRRKIQHPCLTGRQAASSIRHPEAMGDEPYMLQAKLKDMPIIVDANRIRAAKKAINDYGADTVILDDGFQQWKIKKDLEIVVIDTTFPFGNRQMLPRGILREPLSSLGRADIFVLTKTNLNPQIQNIKDFLKRVNPEALIIESVHEPLGFYALDTCACAKGRPEELLRPEGFTGKNVTLISGIADPESFKKTITGMKIDIGLSFEFPDHHHYLREELGYIINESQKKNIDTIVTTEKDAARLYSILSATKIGGSAKNYGGNNQYSILIYALRIHLKITSDEDKFHSRLLKLYSL